jgi:hypothetical protein
LAQAPAKQWDSGCLLSGFTNSSISGYVSQDSLSTDGFGSLDAWVIKLSSTGTKQWDRHWGGDSFESILSIVTPYNLKQEPKNLNLFNPLNLSV